MNESMSRYIPIEHGDFPASIFGNVYIWVVAVTTREAYIVPCRNLKSNLNDPEFGASEGIYLTIPSCWLNQPS